MTLIAGLAFLDETYLVSDSRISYSGYKQSEDRLMKVYQLAPNLAVAFTSEHVDFTLEILRRITVFSLKNLNSKKSLFILPYLIRLAKYEYNQLLKELNLRKPPIMEFLYAGVINKPQMFSYSLLDFIMTKKSGAFQVPEKIGRAMMKNVDGVWSLDPPCPIMYKQLFPDNPSHPYIHLGYVTGGSGQEVFYEIEKEYFKFFDWDLGMTKGIIIENIIDEFIRKKKIPTVGGIVQVWRINSSGLQPVSYVSKEHKDGKERILKELRFTEGSWSLTNHATGEKFKAYPVKPKYFTSNIKVKIKKSSWSNF